MNKSDSTGTGTIDNVPLLSIDLKDRMDVIVVAISLDGEIIYFNRKAEEVIGYKKEEVLRRDAFEIFLPGEYKNIIFQLFEKLKSPGDEDGFMLETDVLTKPGRKRFVRWHYTPIQDKNERLTGILCAGIDETEKDLMLKVAKMATAATDMDQMIRSFMDIISGTLNLRMIRVSLFCDEKYTPFERTNIYPDCQIRKRDGLRLRAGAKNRDEVQPYHREGLQIRDMHRFIPLQVAEDMIGALEFAPHDHISFKNDDIDLLRSLCNIISANIIRINNSYDKKALDNVYNEERFEELMKNASSGIAVVNASDLKFLKANDTFLRLTGTRNAGGKKVEEVFRGLEGSGVVDRMNEALLTRRPCGGKYLKPLKGRKPPVYHVYDHIPIIRDDGRISSIVTVIYESVGSHERSIDPIKRNISKAEELNATISQITDGVAICDVDGNILKMNNELCKVFRMREEDLKDKCIYDVIMFMRPGSISGKPLNKRQLALYRAVRTRNPVKNVMSTIRVFSGSKRLVNTSATPFYDENGKLAGAIAIFRDVTVKDAVFGIGNLMVDIRNIDDLIEESVDIILNALELKTLWFYIYDPLDGELKLKVIKGDFDNTCPLPPRERPDIMNPDLLSRACVEGRTLLIKNYRQCASVRAFDPLAKKRSIRSIASIPLSAAGNLIGVLVAATGDDRAIEEDQLSEITRLSNQLALGISKLTSDQELINSKERAEMYVELLCRDINSINRSSMAILEDVKKISYIKEKDKALVEKLLENLGKSIKIVDGVKNIQQVQRSELSMQYYDLHDVISECISSIEPVQEKRLSVSYNGKPGSFVYASPQIKEIFMNIFDNAIKHSDQDVNVKVDIVRIEEDERTYHRISIEDDGRGIPGELKDRLFQKMVPGSKKAAGKGLGLLMVRTFTEKFGGRVWVEDRIDGDHTKGCRFVVLIPENKSLEFGDEL
ncbi:PAS domain S-box protein [Methanooceanicella nereidis]|nr:PAS domain S-box protein [Methanocella sp. CWC-04]